MMVHYDIQSVSVESDKSGKKIQDVYITIPKLPENEQFMVQLFMDNKLAGTTLKLTTHQRESERSKAPNFYGNPCNWDFE